MIAEILTLRENNVNKAYVGVGNAEEAFGKIKLRKKSFFCRFLFCKCCACSLVYASYSHHTCAKDNG